MNQGAAIQEETTTTSLWMYLFLAMGPIMVGITIVLQKFLSELPALTMPFFINFSTALLFGLSVAIFGRADSTFSLS